ncbi:hypothetical protein CORC01_00334 [Colletotrichum orchidophilum]|uniref:Cyclic nucleotide-binding domain-containing protein n=1 Tax=Colletotrichum orchidophilum TaxID=1209926 RepID=A0A1G4BSR0_9PEZI|nr:uncharacterized protein CORC01_00334 [Colletotrichum orchidophilum]OHF04482.1 hypothetical protein CORC01_00334 [Colletotrichum orchidophilum]
MPPHELLLRHLLVSREEYGDFGGVNCVGVKRILVGLVAVSALSIIAILFAVIFRIRLSRDRASFRALATEQDKLEQVHKTLKNQHEFIRQDCRNLQVTLDFYIKEYGRHPLHNRYRFEPSNVQGSDAPAVAAPSRDWQSLEDDDVFVVVSPSEESLRDVEEFRGEERDIAEGGRGERFSEIQKKTKTPRFASIVAGLQDVPLTPPIEEKRS